VEEQEVAEEEEVQAMEEVQVVHIEWDLDAMEAEQYIEPSVQSMGEVQV
jgi:hypothetical protein